MGNEFGCKGLAESIIVLKNGAKFYVDNTVSDIENQIRSDEERINVEMSMIVSKGKKLSIQKERIDKFYLNK